MDGRVLRNVVLACLYAGALGGMPIQAAIYVDAGATGTADGSSWQNAFPYLQDALAGATVMAVRPIEIRVAQGVYGPDQGTGRTPGDRTATFQLVNGVTLKGGYAGAAAADPNARDVALYETILSGDLAGNDGPDGSNWDDNSCHVVTASGTDGTAVIDGFTVTAGYSAPNKCEELPRDGPGMLIDAGSPRVLNCRFIDNRDGDSGGAVLADNGSCPVLTDCTFLNNQAAGMRNQGNSSPVLTDCRFEGNMIGGIDSRSGSPAITGCVFKYHPSSGISASDGNIVLTGCVFERNGEAVRCSNGNLTMIDCTATGHERFCVEVGAGDLNVLGCTFTGNQGECLCLVRGGGGTGSLTARYCVFRDNVGKSAGAAVGRQMEFYDCEFTGNSGLRAGAICAERAEKLIATRCLFAGNSSEYGPAVLFAQGDFLRLSNCTFADNRGGLGLFEYLGPGGIAAELTECIVWNAPGPLARMLGGPAPVAVRYSDVQGGYPGVGNIDTDPCFVAPGHWGDPNDPHIVLGSEDMNAVWVAGDYYLKSQAGHWDSVSQGWVQDEVTSPCIDAGDPNLPIGIEPFPNGGWLNLGAYGGSAQASKSYFGAPVCETQIPGDINGDCRVDATDQAILLAHWLMEGTMFVNTPPTVKLVAPEDGAELHYPTPVSLRAEATDTDGTVILVHFYIQTRHEMGTATGDVSDTNGADGWGAELNWQHLTGPEGVSYTVWARAMDNDGASTTSPEITITYYHTSESATPFDRTGTR